MFCDMFSGAATTIVHRGAPNVLPFSETLYKLLSAPKDKS
jgi:hypothetical protein